MVWLFRTAHLETLYRLEYSMFQRLLIASDASIFAIITFLCLLVSLPQHFRVPKRENEKKNYFSRFCYVSWALKWYSVMTCFFPLYSRVLFLLWRRAALDSQIDNASRLKHRGERQISGVEFHITVFILKSMSGWTDDSIFIFRNINSYCITINMFLKIHLYSVVSYRQLWLKRLYSFNRTRNNNGVQ
jgi:hypothetical protein